MTNEEQIEALEIIKNLLPKAKDGYYSALKSGLIPQSNEYPHDIQKAEEFIEKFAFKLNF